MRHWPSAPRLCWNRFIWDRLVVFLMLSVYKSPPGVFLCAMEWGDSCSTAPDKCDFLFLTHSKDAALVHTATDSTQ